ncbi:hypothetical protein FANTH_13956, partial [Fusarium anthophilum]
IVRASMPVPKKKKLRQAAALNMLLAHDLNTVSALDILGLKDDWSPIPGCAGPSLSEWKRSKRRTKDELNSFRRSLGNRYSHLVAACKDDNDRLLLLNNAMKYFDTDPEFRLRFWLSRITANKDVALRWPHCSGQECSKTAQTAEEPKGCKVTVEPVWNSGTPDALPSASGENKMRTPQVNDCWLAYVVRDSSTFDHFSTMGGNVKESLIQQGQEMFPLIKTSVCCGEVATKHQAHGFASLQLINPTDFFLRPGKVFEKRKLDQFIKEVLMQTLPCEGKELANELAQLSDAQLALIFRRRLQQRAALAVTSLDSPAVPYDNLESHQSRPATSLDPGNDIENRNNPERLLESNAPGSPPQQGPHITADSPTVAQSDCTRFESTETVDQTPASSPVESPSPSFSLPGDGQVDLHSAPALPPEDDSRASSGLPTCEDEPSQLLYSKNDGLSSGSGAPPHQARPDTTSNVEPLPSSVAARTTTDHGPTTEIDKRRPGQDVTKDNGGAVPISKNSTSVSSRQQDSLSAVDCPTPIEINHPLPEHTEGGRSTTIENLSTASPSPPTSLSGYDIDGRAPTRVDMPFSRKPSAIDSGVKSAGTDNSITASQVSLVSTSGGTALSRKRPIGDVDTESSGIKAKRARLVQGSPAEGLASAIGVTQGDEVEDNTILVPSLESSDHRHALQNNITRALEFAADCPTDHTPAENAGSAGGTVARGTEVSTTGPFTIVPSAYSTEPLTTAGHAPDLVDCGQEISVFGNSQCVSKDDAPTKHNIPEDIDAEIKRICDKNNLQPSVTGRYRNNSIIWRIDSQKGLSELAKSPKYQYEDAIFVKAQGYSCLTFYPEDISKLIDCAKDVIQDDPIHVPPGRRCSINPEQGQNFSKKHLLVAA